MACSTTEQEGMSKVDVSKCPICFEQFKTPRVLSCSHVFCHDCLSSYIISTCQPKEDPLGFHCPVCREFVPSPSFSSNFKDWCQHFRTNRQLGDISPKICEACKRENETEVADTYCLSCCEALCDICTKCHRRSRVSRDHKICRLDEIKCVPELSNIFSNICCEKHKDRPIELFCNDHEEACCAMCCSTEHRKCESVETIQQKAEKVKSSGLVGDLLNDIKEFGQKLSETKCIEEKNITEIEDEADAITGEVQNVKEKIIQNLEKLENEFLDKISTHIKQCKEKLTTNIQTVGDIIHSVELCRKDLETATSLQDVSFLMGFLKTKKTLEYIKNKQVEKIEFKLQSTLELDFKAVANLSKIGNAEIIEKRERLSDMFDVKNLLLELYQEMQFPGSSIRSVIFLSDTEVIFPDWNTDTVKRYSTKKDKWNFQNEIMLVHSTFDIKRNGDFYFASCISSKKIKILSAEDFQILRTVNVGKACYGISFWNHFLYTACHTAIIKMDTEGNILRTYPTASGVHYVAVTRNGHIVFSIFKGKHSVSAITNEGDTVWTYSHEKLKHPYGLHIDCDDIIYVAGTNSNNVHVLTSDGFLLRMIEDMPSPVFFIFNKDRNICCMGTNVWGTSIKMYAVKF
ncbi:E3 ubiquitin-protein ligase TRIM8-like [Saccostrea echinata]|uniref:E3 ubiquitin-protein ligase TRIM8-like n=1 Tax=Saccostrea echinata TaxID=191078 RepID=UPI002A7F0BA5|nr:E3 ubiquitin-protein ligase TRIM8-like [Saccostrea echinata]